MAIKGILFDKDDTLISLATFWRQPVHQLAVYMAKSCGLGEDKALIGLLEAAAGFEKGSLIAESPVVAGTNKSLVEACVKVLEGQGITLPGGINTLAEDYLAKACITYGQVEGRGNLGELLPQLKAMGCSLGIATSDSYEPVMHCLRALNAHQYFDMVLAADRVKYPKPSPDMALAFCEAFGLKPEEVCMVGDSANDMLFAKNSGIMGILFTTEQLSSLPPGTDYVITDLSQLPQLIKGL